MKICFIQVFTTRYYDTDFALINYLIHNNNNNIKSSSNTYARV